MVNIPLPPPHFDPPAIVQEVDYSDLRTQRFAQSWGSPNITINSNAYPSMIDKFTDVLTNELNPYRNTGEVVGMDTLVNVITRALIAAGVEGCRNQEKLYVSSIFLTEDGRNILSPEDVAYGIARQEPGGFSIRATCTKLF
jgi:hypothetical protein